MKRLMEAALPVALSAGLALGAAGCVESDPGYELDASKPSRVAELEYIPAHTQTIDGPCLYSQDGICYIEGDVKVLVPDEWNMTLEQCDNGPRRNSKSKDCDSGTYEISEDTYNSLRVGNIVIRHGGNVEIVPQ